MCQVQYYMLYLVNHHILHTFLMVLILSPLYRRENSQREVSHLPKYTQLVSEWKGT